MSRPASSNQFLGYAEQLSQITTLMRSCADERKGSSAFLIGPHGSGKTALITAAWNSLSQKPVLVFLDGLHCHDGHVAVKTFAEGLQIDLTSFQSRGVTDDLVILFDALRGGSSRSCIPEAVVSRGVILVLDSIDAFCSHRNQTFLYEAFECAMRTQYGAPDNAVALCVIGTTTRTDAVGLLEKRVRSRFSQRTIFMFAAAFSFDNFCELLLNQIAQLALTQSNRKSKDRKRESTGQAESAVRKIIQEDESVQETLKRLLLHSRDLRVARKLAAYIVVSQSINARTIIEATQKLLDCSSTQPIDAISACSAVEISALIAAHRVVDRAALQRRFASRTRRGAAKRLAEDEIDAPDCLTFEQLEREYGAFVSRTAASSQPLAVAADRQVLYAAFERLASRGLLTPAGSVSSSGSMLEGSGANLSASALAFGSQRLPAVLGFKSTDLRRDLERSSSLPTELRQFVHAVNMSLS